VAGTRAEQDALRFQAWQVAALESHPAGTVLTRVGPFSAVVPATAGAVGWVTMVAAEATERETTAAVALLRTIFEGRAAPFEIEFNERLYPRAGRWLEAAGLALAERNPLMACRPADFKPYAAAGVSVHRLSVSSTAADLRAFQDIRWTNGGDNDEVPQPVDRLRHELASRNSVYLLARLDGKRAGTGVSHTLRGAVEIVGVVTQSTMRRRGVAATVTSDLVSRHFGSGGDYAFLDSANAEATRVYERLGFSSFGANLVYRDPENRAIQKT
jgi:ribosomal protein S18 acetylase RimI-like enzyme